MSTFLITFKPADENRQKGWPLENLLALVSAVEATGAAEESWRFSNHSLSKLGDVAYLLLQGKRGPAIIGKGTIVAKTVAGITPRKATVRFTKLVDPRQHVFVTTEELLSISGASHLWNTNSSGVRLADEVASAVDAAMTAGGVRPAPPHASATESTSTVRNPDWTRDELIVALDFYLQHRPNPPGQTTADISGLSAKLRALGARLFPAALVSNNTFRNANGVYMKLMNFRRFDPVVMGTGTRGLSGGNLLEEEVWLTFSEDPAKCARAAEAILKALNDPDMGEGIILDTSVEDDDEEASEGRVLTKLHKSKERDGKFPKKKKAQVLAKTGRLACAACSFEFISKYGPHGAGYIECHHTVPVSSLGEHSATRMGDLVLLCANCHRMIHKRRPWLSVAELVDVLNKASGSTSA